MVLKFKVLGVKETRNFLKSKDKNTELQMVRALIDSKNLMIGEVVDSISGRSKEPSSVDTGRFRSSVRGTVRGSTAIIFSTVEYAKFIEFGTSKLSPRRHFRNSLSRNREKIISLFKKRIKNI